MISEPAGGGSEPAGGGSEPASDLDEICRRRLLNVQHHINELLQVVQGSEPAGGGSEPASGGSCQGTSSQQQLIPDTVSIAMGAQQKYLLSVNLLIKNKSRSLRC